MLTPFKAQQRGVDGTVQILKALTDGLDLESKRLYVLDLLPNKHLSKKQLYFTTVFVAALQRNITIMLFI